MSTADLDDIDPHLALPDVLGTISTTARFATSGVLTGALPSITIRGVGRLRYR